MTPKLRIVSDGKTFRVQRKHWFWWYDMGTARRWIMGVFMGKHKFTDSHMEYWEDGSVTTTLFQVIDFPTLDHARQYVRAFYTLKVITPPDFRVVKEEGV